MRELEQLGVHALYREGPLVIFESRGDFSLEEAQQALIFYDRVIAEEGYLLLLLDVTNSGVVDSRTRRVMVDWGKEHIAKVCTALCGHSLFFRTAFSLIMSAIKILSRQPVRFTICSNREHALAWLQASRQ